MLSFFFLLTFPTKTLPYVFYLLFVWSYAKLVLDDIGIQEFSGFEEAGLAVQPSAGWYAGQTVIRI